MASVPVTNSSTAYRRRRPDWLTEVLDWIMHPVELIFVPIQRRFGTQKMAWFFVLPNLIIFAIFIMLPMLLNFYYAFTGSTNFFPQDRPFVGTSNFTTLLTCENFLQPVTCEQDIFWRAVWNTGVYVVFEVGGIVLISLVTAVALNQRIKARGFFRSIFFIQCCCHPSLLPLSGSGYCSVTVY